MENVPAMSGINERAAARIMKDVLGEASCKTDVLANIVRQLRNGNGAEAQKGKNCEPTEIDGCNASVIEKTYAPYPGLRGVLNNEESANNIVSEDCVDGVVQEDTKNRVITMSETAGSSAELRLRRRAQGGCAVDEPSGNKNLLYWPSWQKNGQNCPRGAVGHHRLTPSKYR